MAAIDALMILMVGRSAFLQGMDIKEDDRMLRG